MNQVELKPYENTNKAAIELKRLSIDDGNDIYNMLQEIPAEENGLIMQMEVL